VFNATSAPLERSFEDVHTAQRIYSPPGTIGQISSEKKKNYPRLNSLWCISF